MTNQTGRHVTITAIAREAGVSVSTVSKVLNGRADVAEGTRSRVEELLAKHAYPRARRRGSDPAGLIDIVFDELDSPWAVEIIRGAEEVAHAAGTGTVVSAIHARSEPARQWLDNLERRRSEGVVLVVDELTAAQRARLQALDVPCIVIDPRGEPDPQVPSIGAANWAGGQAATRHLIELGHRRIAIISGPAGMLCSRARLDGYRGALEGAGLPADPALVRHGDFHHESGYLQAARLLELPDPPTAIFAGSDQQAFGACEAARERGLRIPQDLSIVGFDDLPVARWFSPPLTTVRQPLAEMGSLATRLLFRLSRGETLETHHVELATELVIRESTAPPPAPARP
ncbi:LacI family DNA-binding transcriptional regulator [Thermomonospora echinospora]|uniref:LacI family DNA-binding transcriptional regulator n=1 Tax=Thermomonospora echinospora TaxID=1992 RepID=UPI001F2FA26B|nr:LacI family DNA-binding transcriptional regulator [Thermomonospora echinospora]